MRQKSSQLILLAAITVLTLAPSVVAQSAAASLAALPEADILIYVSPQRILNDAAPRVVAPAEITKMRAVFADLKKGAGIDPSTLHRKLARYGLRKPAVADDTEYRTVNFRQTDYATGCGTNSTPSVSNTRCGGTGSNTDPHRLLSYQQYVLIIGT